MRNRRHWVVSAMGLCAMVLIFATFAGIASARHHHRKAAENSERGVSNLVLAFGRMYGVDGGFVGPANAIRGVEGDEAPWTVGSARGFLTTDGHLRIQVRGLVFSADVPPPLGGTNDEPTFRGMVSCLSEDETTGAVTTANVTTAEFPATPTGDSDIAAQVALPNPCVAPIVLVLAGSEDKWFAVNGFEAGEGDGTASNGDDDHGDEGDDNNQGDDNDQGGDHDDD